MGKPFSWDTLNEASYNHTIIENQPNELCKNDILLLDQLNWAYKKEQKITKSLDECETKWFKQVMRGAKYSRVGKKYIIQSHDIECIKIDRVKLDTNPKAQPQSKKRRTIPVKSKAKRPKVVRCSSGSSRTESICSDDRNNESLTNSSSSMDINQCLLYQSDPVPHTDIDPLKYDFSFTIPLASAV